MLKKIAWILNILVAIGLLFSYLAPQIDPSVFSWFSVMGLLFPMFLFANVFFALLWIFKWEKKAWLSVGIVLLGAFYIPRFAGILPHTSSSNNSTSFSIATYNVRNATEGYDRNKAKRKLKREKLEKFHHLLRLADIVCIQEKGAYATDIIHSVYNEHEMHSYKNRGTAILSRFPIIDKGLIDFGTVTNSCLWADIEILFDTVRVYSIHLESNRITIEAKKVLDNADFQEEETWKGIGGILDKFRYYNIKRSEQSKQVKKHMEQSPYPVILAGDFNDTPMSHTYEVLSKNMKDSFVEKGTGLGTTYVDDIPFLRIDYVMTSPKIDVLSHNVKYSKFSDHYPVLVEVALDK